MTYYLCAYLYLAGVAASETEGDGWLDFTLRALWFLHPIAVLIGECLEAWEDWRER